ncbi:MAG: BACK domain-containing protein, partial [Waddliaceae bacterium]
RRFSRRRNQGDTTEIAASACKFIEKNYEKFGSHVDESDKKTVMQTLQLLQELPTTPEKKGEIKTLIRNVEIACAETKLKGVLKYFSDVKRNSKKIHERINKQEETIGELEKKMLKFYEQESPEEDSSIFPILHEVDEKNKVLGAEVHEKVAECSEHIDKYRKIVNELQLPEDSDYYRKLDEKARKVLREVQDLSSKLVIHDRRILELCESVDETFPQVLMRHKGGLITVPFAVMKKVPFFQGYRSSIEGHEASTERGGKKEATEKVTLGTGLTKAEKRKYPQALFACDVRDYSEEAIQTYIDYRVSGDLWGTEEETVMELYRLADYVRDEELLSTLKEYIEENGSKDTKISLFMQSPYNQGVTHVPDPLAQMTFETVVKRFNKLEDTHLFALSPNVMSEILKRDDVVVEDELQLYDMVMRWAENQTQENPGKTVQDIIYEGEPGERLVDLIRFEHLPLEKISRRGFLKEEERIKWEEFHRNPDTSLERISRKEFFQRLVQEEQERARAEYEQTLSWEEVIPGYYLE